MCVADPVESVERGDHALVKAVFVPICDAFNAARRFFSFAALSKRLL
jgi:hypothetical protein